jgi:ligand-binding SRPBCC domain-containing protein
MVEGMRRRFAASQWLPYPVPVVFAFLANPQHLPLLTPAYLRVRIEKADLVVPALRPVTPHTFRSAAAGAGSTMTISFRPFPLSPLRMRWKAAITEFAWNDHFCDRQTRGPFVFWEHCHRVQEENGGTRIVDEVTYEMKLGADRLIPAELLMQKLFHYRQQTIEQALARWQSDPNAPLRPAPRVRQPLRKKAGRLKWELMKLKKQISSNRQTE